MKASIIILAYNNVEKIHNALESCFSQTYRDFEIIVRDDGSKNFDIANVEKEFKNCPQRISYQIIHDENNLGTVKNFNQAIKASVGDVIIPLACDDQFASSISVEKIIDEFKNNPEAACITSREKHVELDGSSSILPSPMEEKIVIHGDSRLLYFSISAFPCYMVGSSTAYRRTILEKYNYFDTDYRLLEDWPFYLKLLENGEKISFLPAVTIIHNAGGVSTPKGKYRNLLLVNDDIRCISYVINQKKVPLTRVMLRLLKCRNEILRCEKEHKKLEKLNYIKYFDALVLRWIRGKVRKISIIFDNRE